MEQQRDRNADQDDATLVASVLAGEREAFDILLQRYWSTKGGRSPASVHGAGGMPPTQSPHTIPRMAPASSRDAGY